MPNRGKSFSLIQGGRAWRYGYDALGRPQTVRDTLGRMTTFAYNNADRLRSQVLPGNRTLGFGYDASGNLDTLTVPGGLAHTFAYTEVGLNETYTPPSVTGISDPATRYEFNGDRQLTRATRPDGGLVLARYSSTTGQLDSLTQARGKNAFSYFSTGQVSSVTSPDGVTLNFGYDGPVGRSQSWASLRGAGSVDSVSTLVDIGFRDSVQTVNGGSPAAFGYDRDGLLDSVSVNSTTERIIRRSGDGLLEQTDVGGVRSQLSYSNHGELWKLTYTWTGGGSFQQVLDRDSLGQITRVTESGINAHTYDYHYDAAGRLDSVAVDGAAQAGYTYDVNGNRVAARAWPAGDTTSATYDEQDRMRRYGARGYAYTAAGELTSRVGGPSDTLRTTYDALDNLTGARSPAGDSLSYVIDGANRRVGRAVNGTRRSSWLYEDALGVIAELDSAGSVANRYVYGTLGHVPDLMVRGGVTYRLISDQLGSVRAVVNVSTGAVAQRMDYDAWGVITTDTAPTFQSLGYAGGLEDRATGLVRFGARDYETATGRWTAKDPIGFQGGQLNLTAYCADDPLNLLDPSGLLLGGLVPAGESLADDAMAWYAAQLADPNNPSWAGVPLWAGGSFASLWSSCNSDKTAATLLAAYMIRVFGPFPPKGPPRLLERLRRYFRFDPPHHGKGWGPDGEIPKAIGGWFR